MVWIHDWPSTERRLFEHNEHVIAIVSEVYDDATLAPTGWTYLAEWENRDPGEPEPLFGSRNQAMVACVMSYVDNAQFTAIADTVPPPTLRTGTDPEEVQSV